MLIEPQVSRLFIIPLALGLYSHWDNILYAPIKINISYFVAEGSSGSESSSGDITLMSGSPALQSSVHAEGFASHEAAAAAATTRTTIASGGLRGESVQQTSSQRGDCQLHASAVAAAAADDSDPLQLLHSMQSHYFSEQQK